ncbi:Asp23/Gls24 family envelope stress response protein [Leifsonia sp. A12D58]|uniref:Asp23/Gls24 family envelope stress response protein n=1 Tax=Leifsonia sp. A12D58 TaxID=3397674 RepID=UPI0039DF9527
MTPDPTPPTSTDEDIVVGDLAVSDLDGHTVDELLEYYDAGFAPADPSIDNSAGCQIALAAIRRLRTLTDEFLEDESRTLPPLDGSWITGILNQISVQAQAGRDIPLYQLESDSGVVVTEGAVRAIIRSAGDDLPGLLVGRIRFTGDITRPGAPVGVDVDATAIWGRNIPESADELKHAIAAELNKHTHLNVTSINVTIHDIQQTTS